MQVPTFAFRLPEHLRAAAEKDARRRGVTLSRALVEAIAAKYGTAEERDAATRGAGRAGRRNRAGR